MTIQQPLSSAALYNFDELIHEDKVHRLIYTDEGIFRDEMRKIFGAVWVFLAHESQIPENDDFVKSKLGLRPIIVVRDFEEAMPLVNRLAAEHLELAVDDPDALFAKVRHAGSVFLGRMTPEAVGDYVAGPNHVLPTGRRARFSSGLSVLDFMKRTSFLSLDTASIGAIGPAAVALAEAEGLPAHAASVSLRLP